MILKSSRITRWISSVDGLSISVTSADYDRAPTGIRHRPSDPAEGRSPTKPLNAADEDVAMTPLTLDPPMGRVVVG